jgi:DNA-binding response OmpR family regulator
MTGTNQDATVSALAVGEFDQDRRLLHDIFRDLGWRLFEARDRRRAMQYLERNPVHVVLAESDLPNWNWKKVLNDIRRLAQPPQLIVTSRTADDYLWAEVLNIGGYDVLPQPFERDEVERVVAAAHRHHAFPPARATASAVTAAAIVA